MMLQRKEKRGMGIAIWKLTYSLTTYPPTQKDFFFFFRRKRGAEYFGRIFLKKRERILLEFF